MYALLIAAATLWGAATGSLLPRAAYRLAVEPEEPWRDSCPAGHPFTGPAGGWLGAGRCGACAGAGPAGPGTPGARTAPVVTALVCAALAAATGPRPELAGWLAAAPVAVLLALVDARVHRLPDRLTLPLAAGTAVLLGAAALLPGHRGSWTTALLGGLVLGAGYGVLFLVNPAGLGFGDVKLALGLGVALGWYGWGVLFLGAFAGFVLGAVYGLALILLRRASRRSAIPFGPFMLGGTLAALLLAALAANP
ncbi:A24 family peptidase [Streptomyces sp. LP05-1]|uniref:A24 family peptidase n=1 Tax=Streptomyces pyxinae TaxID=2970734 RepID=A0ABT2CAT0_9ACTN|nr:A24 family peptidase [Streptomyces sp. LP05-1]MCS0634510.1 A24 family peptidase [Streptomyces sp. LP05-1]